MLFETDKRIDEHNKELMDCHARLTKAKKQVALHILYGERNLRILMSFQYEAALKKGDKVRIGARENEFKTVQFTLFLSNNLVNPCINLDVIAVFFHANKCRGSC